MVGRLVPSVPDDHGCVFPGWRSELDWAHQEPPHSTLCLSDWAVSSDPTDKGSLTERCKDSVIAHPPPPTFRQNDNPSLKSPAPARPFLLSSRPFVELLGSQPQSEPSYKWGMMTTQVWAWMCIVLLLKIILIYFYSGFEEETYGQSYSWISPELYGRTMREEIHKIVNNYQDCC